MEKKTIGKFISALRRANGMTQAELAEKLFVSDKTVSRWERDESSPDLELIPAIADIFGVTSDELLRGERIPAHVVLKNGKPNAEKERESKRLQKLLEKQLKKRYLVHKILSLVFLGFAALGVIVGTVLAVAFPWRTTSDAVNPAWLGGSISIAAILVASLGQICLIYFSRYLPEAEEEVYACVADFRKKSNDYTAVIFLFLFSLLGFSLPLFFARAEGYAYAPTLILLHSSELGFLAFPLVGATAYFWWKNRRFPFRFGACALSCVALTIGLVSYIAFGVRRAAENNDYDLVSFNNLAGVTEYLQKNDEPDDIPISENALEYTWRTTYRYELAGVKGAWNVVCRSDGEEVFRFFWSNVSVDKIVFQDSLTTFVYDQRNEMTDIEENRHIKYTWLYTLCNVGVCGGAYLLWRFKNRIFRGKTKKI